MYIQNLNFDYALTKLNQG